MRQGGQMCPGSTRELQALFCPSSPGWPSLPQALGSEGRGSLGVAKASYPGPCHCSQKIRSLCVCSRNSLRMQRHYYVMSDEERSLTGSQGHPLPAWVVPLGQASCCRSPKGSVTGSGWRWDPFNCLLFRTSLFLNEIQAESPHQAPPRTMPP